MPKNENSFKNRRTTRVVICDDHPVSQMGVKCALEDIFPEVVFHFSKVTLGKEAVKVVQADPPHLLILDLRLPDISGLEVLKKLRAKPLATKIMVLTSEESIHVLVRLLRHNVDAILLKSYTLPMLEAAFRHIEENHSGRTYLDPALEKQLALEADKQLLSPREFEVLELLLKGHTNKAIGALLKCSPETVKAHRAKIRVKTKLNNRDQMLAWFHRGIEK